MCWSVRVGVGCAVLHDRLFQNLNVPLIELDEAWSYIGKKQKRLTPEDSSEKGDQYVFIALDATNKAILTYLVGKRTSENTVAFVADLQIVKKYVGEPPINAARRYSPGTVVGVDKSVLMGQPDPKKISTSLVERQNLSLRMSQRRFTRLTNAFSKKLENHCAAVSLYVSHYNLCRVHETIRVTPAMALGVTDHIWTIGELIERASQPETMPERHQPFTVIDGGLS